MTLDLEDCASSVAWQRYDAGGCPGSPPYEGFRRCDEPPSSRIRPEGLLAKIALPCRAAEDFDYGECYSYYANGCYNTCQFVEIGDIEDFMNNEKRKEKSRDAARSRRSRETEIFNDLAAALPLSKDQVSQLDKASVMRLAIAYLRVRDMVGLVPKDNSDEDEDKNADGSLFLKSLEGFLLVLSAEGDFVYLSENVCEYLGITQIDIMGQNIFEYSHPCDHDEIREMLSSKSQDDNESPKSVFIRLKCTLTSKGRSVNLKSATYKVIHCTGHMVRQKPAKKCGKSDAGSMQSCFVAVGKPIPHPSNIDTPLPRQTFLTKHSLDMKFTHADDEFMMDVLGYNPDDLIGKSVYEYHHAMDSDSIGSAYKCLFSKGQCETNKYRFLAKTGGYVWVVTQATLIYDKVHKPQSVVCVNYVISGVERPGEVYSAEQAEHRAAAAAKAEEGPDEPRVAEKKAGQDEEGATEKLFAPRTKDMNKGFLTFSEEEPGITMLKDEPDDLTHLAPVAGDVCVPLEEPCGGAGAGGGGGLQLADFDELLLMRDGGLGPLLGDGSSLADPFIAYRDLREDSVGGPSPQLLSPNLSKSSDCSLPSLSSPSDSLLDEDQMSTFINLQMDEEPDLTLKAPFIPMNLTDDLPLLPDLMWNSNDKYKGQLDNNNSSLAQLLSTSVNKHTLKSSDHGGGLLEEQDDIDEIYEKKYSPKSWSATRSHHADKLPRTLKRSSAVPHFERESKRCRVEPKEKMSTELLQQLMSTNHHRGRPKGKSNWLLDSGVQKAACVSQPSDSVLMNLLNNESAPEAEKMDVDSPSGHPRALPQRQPANGSDRRSQIRKNSLSLLVPEGGGLASLLDLTQQDYDVNAPVNSMLLQGEELLTALEVNAAM